MPRGCNGKTVGLYARLRISIYYTGTNILYAERRCPMCNFDASLPVSRDPPCYSLYIRSLGSGDEGDGRTDGRTDGWRAVGGGGGGEKGKEEKDGGTREREKKGLWIRGNLKREKRKRGPGTTRRTVTTIVSLRLGRRTRYDKIDPPDRAIDLVNNQCLS